MWQDDAACKGYDLDVFFPPRNGTDYRAAKQICAGCDVTRPCLEQAMLAERGLSGAYRHGVCSGLSGQERAALARKGWRPATHHVGSAA